MSRRILVLEDDEHVQHNIARTFRHHDVRCAATLAGGTLLGMELDPELVICDYNLADGTGREVLRALRDQGMTAPVLLISSDITHEDWIEWAAALTDDFLPKPFGQDQLKIKAQRLLAIDATAREAARQHAELTAVAARDARETQAAQLLLDRMLQRGTFDPAFVKVDQVLAGQFGGDAVFATHVGDRYRWLVGDVSGHTLSSALVTIPLSMLFYGGCSQGLTLVELVASINAQLGVLLPTSMFCAASILEIDRKLGTLTVWNGGSPDVVVRTADGDIRRIGSTDSMLAVIRGGSFVPEVVTVPVATGDRVFAFTDGLFEVCAPDGSLLGLDAACAEIARGPMETAFERVGALWRGCQTQTSGADDMTLVEVLV